MTSTHPPFVSELRDELVAAARRKIERRRRRQRRTFNGLLAFTIVVIAASVLRFAEKPSDAGVLSVTRSNHLISVDLKSTNATAKQIADELSHDGIDATVSEVPVSPSGVGRFVALQHEGQINTEPSSIYFQHFTLADQKHQHIDLRLGRKAQPNETYIKLANAYDDGEPLHCSNTLGRQVKDVIDQLNHFNLTISWFNQAGPEITTIGSPPYPNFFINGAVSDKPNSLRIYVSAEPIPFFGNSANCP